MINGFKSYSSDCFTDLAIPPHVSKAEWPSILFCKEWFGSPRYRHMSPKFHYRYERHNARNLKAWLKLKQMSNSLVRLITTKDTSYQLCFGGWYLTYRYTILTKKCQQEKKNENNYDPCFFTDKQIEALEKILGCGFLQVMILTDSDHQIHWEIHLQSHSVSQSVMTPFLIWIWKPSFHSQHSPA